MKKYYLVDGITFQISEWFKLRTYTHKSGIWRYGINGTPEYEDGWTEYNSYVMKSAVQGSMMTYHIVNIDRYFTNMKKAKKELTRLKKVALENNGN